MSVECRASKATSSRPWIHYQLPEEQSGTGTCPRIPGIHFQHIQDENQRTQEEDAQPFLSDKATTNLIQKKDMSMDCRTHWEDESHATSNRRCFTTPEISAERPGTKSSSKPVLSQSAFKDLDWWEQTATTKNGLMLREQHVHLPPAITIYCDASDSGWGVASSHIQTTGFWSTIEREDSINVRELKTVKFALLHAREFEGKPLQLFTDNTTAAKYAMRSGGTASIALQDLALEINEIIDRYKIKAEETIVRMEASKAIFQNAGGPLRPTESRRICLEREQTNQDVLKLSTRPGSSSDRCFSRLALKGSVSSPPVAIDPQGDTQAAEGQGQQGCPSHPKLAQPVLMANGSESEQVIPIKARSVKEVNLDRLAIIREYQNDEINEEVSGISIPPIAQVLVNSMMGYGSNGHRGATVSSEIL
ncbi:hypothetical protein [Parasitella parasitica]|uniref:RNase H type-1 domain-containing protein n=1 Tax=Parasitella parasitica TaxID=35722 RepID=A0A0B7N5B2_9FUNG|nr:hypothetical protein [Parasitella parasitica]